MGHTRDTHAPSGGPRLRDVSRFGVDLGVWMLALPLAYLARFDWSIPDAWLGSLLVSLGCSTAIKCTVLATTRVYKQSWRSISLSDVLHLARAVFWAFLAFTLVSFFLRPHVIIPRSIPLLDAVFATLLLGSARVLQRLRFERKHRPLTILRTPARRAVLVGAGEHGSLLAKEMLRHPDIGLEPVAFVDDDPRLHGTRIASVPVAGSLDDLAFVASRFEADEILIAIRDPEGAVVRRVVDNVSVASTSLPVRIMPAVADNLRGGTTITRLRSVEVADLLRRPSVKLDVSAIRNVLSGKKVLVTGAGGSIGAEIVRQVIQYGVTEVFLLGRGENSLYALERELDRTAPNAMFKTFIGDVRDLHRMRQVFASVRPDIVFHTAAHKHVPLMESNPSEAVRNNIEGTYNVTALCLEHGVQRFVHISSDKAVNPTSIMGATKRVGEWIVQAASRRAADPQRLVSVRFGNVLGSRGSVIPLFQEQIRAGGPITVTHRDMQRYFMTIPEATQLVLQAASLAENGAIYVLDMGEPVNIYDLACHLIRLSGLEPGKDIHITFSGVRPGEKLSEELFSEVEERTTRVFGPILEAHPPAVSAEELESLRSRFADLNMRGNQGDVKSTLMDFVHKHLDSTTVASVQESTSDQATGAPQHE